MINKTILLGNVGNDSETRTLSSGRAITKFSLATNESWKDDNGEWQTTTEWHNVIQWANKAEHVKTFTKGEKLYIEGKIKYSSNTNDDGVTKYYTQIIAKTIKRLDKRQEVAEQQGPPPQGADDDLPF